MLACARAPLHTPGAHQHSETPLFPTRACLPIFATCKQAWLLGAPGSPAVLFLGSRAPGACGRRRGAHPLGAAPTAVSPRRHRTLLSHTPRSLLRGPGGAGGEAVPALKHAASSLFALTVRRRPARVFGPIELACVVVLLHISASSPPPRAQSCLESATFALRPGVLRSRLCTGLRPLTTLDRSRLRIDPSGHPYSGPV